MILRRESASVQSKLSPTDDHVHVTPHLNIFDPMEEPLSAKTESVLLSLAKKANDIMCGARNQGCEGFLELVLTDAEFHRTVKTPVLSTARRAKLEQRKRQLENVGTHASHVIVRYAALDFVGFFSALRTHLGEERYRNFSHSLILGGAKEGVTYYDSAKLLFVILQRQLGGLHFRMDADIEDDNGRALEIMIQAAKMLDRNSSTIISGTYADHDFLQACQEDHFENIDLRELAQNFSIRPIVAAPVGPIVSQLQSGKRPAEIVLEPNGDFFAQSVWRLVNLVNDITSQTETERVISGAYLHATERVWEPCGPQTQFTQLTTWVDDGALPLFRNKQCHARQIPDAVVVKNRVFEMSGLTLSQQSANYLPTLLRGIAMMAMISDAAFASATTTASNNLDAFRQDLWQTAHAALSQFVTAVPERLPGTFLHALIEGENHQCFPLLRDHGFAEVWPYGVHHAVQQMKRFIPGDLLMPWFCQSICHLLDDVLVNAALPMHDYWDAVVRVSRDQTFPELVGPVFASSP